MANKCKDCGYKADPKCTVRPDGDDELYFCKKCLDKALDLWAPVQAAIDDGRLTEEQVLEAIKKAKEK